MKEMLKKIRQRGQEMKGEPVLKAEFPAGSSDSVPASAAGREAMPGPVPGDEVAGKASPFDWLNKVLKPLEPPAGASAGRTFQAPLLVPAHKPSSHRRGPPRGKNKPRGEKKSLESNDIWKQIVEELHKGNGESISLSLVLGLSSRGLWLHIWTRRARHSRKGSMAAWLPRCCFHALWGCFPAWPGCSFSPASAGRHWASAHRQTKLHHQGHAPPEIPCNFQKSLSRSGGAADWRRERFRERHQSPSDFLKLIHDFDKTPEDATSPVGNSPTCSSCTSSFLQKQMESLGRRKHFLDKAVAHWQPLLQEGRRCQAQSQEVIAVPLGLSPAEA
ncbi:uncharacterized protein LOC118691648 isoform X3 [Molothrus ater]|uniref:uncharacterized protein LOC118691648 isoform X3 n=1 Tax=Molothrus ater TaxID=84834 RepID=UPI00174D687B|nr:uncharacterized protein LOC118691648 isoform X3 [Molothrus ater]